MNIVDEYRVQKLDSRHRTASTSLQVARDREDRLKNVYSRDPSGENRRAVLEAVKARIEVLEELLGLEMYAATLYEDDPEQKAKLDQAVTTTRAQLNLAYSHFQPGGAYGFYGLSVEDM